MSNDLHNQKCAVTSAENAPVAEESKRRRRMLLGGGSAVLASLKSGSALAGGVCLSPSSFSSITASTKTSNAPRTYGGCSSHGFYGNAGNNDMVMDGKWSPVNRSAATLENQDFPSKGRWELSTKLRDIISTGQNPLWHEDANLIVIYLDVKTGRANGAITLSQVHDLWRALFGLSAMIALDSPIRNWTAMDVKDFYKVWVDGSYPT